MEAADKIERTAFGRIGKSPGEQPISKHHRALNPIINLAVQQIAFVHAAVRIEAGQPVTHNRADLTEGPCDDDFAVHLRECKSDFAINWWRYERCVQASVRIKLRHIASCGAAHLSEVTSY